MDAERPVAPKEGRWIARPRKPRWVVPVVFFTILGSQLPSWVNLVVRGHEAWVWIVFAGYAIIVLLGALFWIVRAWRGGRETVDAEAMLDGGFGDQYPADVTIVVEGRRLGSDRGVVWFADGLMGFSGRAASFVLAPEDVQPRIAHLRQDGRVKSVPPNAVALRNAPKAAYVVVTPLGRHALRYRSRLNAFLPSRGATEDERLVRYVMAPGSASGERQWPPLEPYREGIASEMVRP